METGRPARWWLLYFRGKTIVTQPKVVATEVRGHGRICKILLRLSQKDLQMNWMLAVRKNKNPNGLFSFGPAPDKWWRCFPKWRVPGKYSQVGMQEECFRLVELELSIVLDFPGGMVSWLLDKRVQSSRQAGVRDINLSCQCYVAEWDHIEREGK